MGKLHQYFETDTARMHVKVSVGVSEIDGIVLFDFQDTRHFYPYVPELTRSSFFIRC